MEYIELDSTDISNNLKMLAFDGYRLYKKNVQKVRVDAWIRDSVNKVKEYTYGFDRSIYLDYVYMINNFEEGIPAWLKIGSCVKYLASIGNKLNNGVFVENENSNEKWVYAK